MIKYIKRLKILIGVLVGLHLFIFFALVFQEQLIFRSKEVSDNYKFKILIPHKEYVWKDTVLNRQLYNAIYTPRKNTIGHIFFLHGTSNNVEYHTQYIPYFTERGFQVWMMDYVGFGKSRGDRSEELLIEDASRMFDTFAVQNHLDPTDIIIVGKDLGTGIASKIALMKSAKKLVLISPYNDLISLYKDYIPWFPFQLFLNYQLSNAESIQAFKGDVGIFFGANSMLIPYRNARKLQKVLKTGNEYHEYNIKLAENVVDAEDFQSDLENFLKK